MRIITLNVNGIRSAERKGLSRWLARVEPWDVVCLQEIKADDDDMPRALRAPRKCARGIPSRRRRKATPASRSTRGIRRASRTGFGHPEFDAEGRYLEADFGDARRSSASTCRRARADRTGRRRSSASSRRSCRTWRSCASAAREIVLCGDWNIAHQPIDLKNWRSNQKNSGFLPEERAWLTRVFDELGFVDVFRRVDPRPDQYTWWSNRGQAWAKNVGWRIDYQIATPGIAAKAAAASIYKNRRFSDHAPLIIDYDYEL